MTPGRLIRRVYNMVFFFFYFIYELLAANLRVAWDVATPRHFARPAIVAVPMDARTDLEIALLALCIGFTPGTLSMDVSADRRYIYVHTMYLGKPDEFKRFEAKLLRALRWT